MEFNVQKRNEAINNAWGDIQKYIKDKYENVFVYGVTIHLNAGQLVIDYNGDATILYFADKYYDSTYNYSMSLEYLIHNWSDIKARIYDEYLKEIEIYNFNVNK